MEPDPFSGTWRFRADLSAMGRAAPREWTQEILRTPEAISATEQITHSSGRVSRVSVKAKFDGNFFPVVGSPMVDEIAYRRSDLRTISATASKGGRVAMTETAIISADGQSLTFEFSFVLSNGQVKNARAVFEKVSK